LKGLDASTAAQASKTKTDSDAIIELTDESLVKKSAVPSGKSSVDKPGADTAEESERKSSK
jgi:hypothetical protein